MIVVEDTGGLVEQYYAQGCGKYETVPQPNVLGLDGGVVFISENEEVTSFSYIPEYLMPRITAVFGDEKMDFIDDAISVGEGIQLDLEEAEFLHASIDAISGGVIESYESENEVTLYFHDCLRKLSQLLYDGAFSVKMFPL